MQVIEIETMTLEPLTGDHAEAMFAVLSDPAIYEYEGEPPKSVEALRTRYEKLESRRSPDGTEHWLNWLIRLRSGELAGYVQATVFPDDRAAIAYELNSRYWGKGIAREAVLAMMDILRDEYNVRTFNAWLKVANYRSLRFLEKLGFEEVPPEERANREVAGDELLMVLSMHRNA